MGVASDAVIVSVEPPEEISEPGPAGHTIKVNRVAFGIDALPSASNDVGGVSFTAPCGCVHLYVDAKLADTRVYWQHYASVTFENALRDGKHTYRALYAPATDEAMCDPIKVCPPVAYHSGVLEVVVDSTGTPTFSNRCEKCPAWCDPSHHLYAKKSKTHGHQCEYGVRDVVISDVPYQSQLDASCKPNYLCGYAATNMLTARLHGVEPTTKFMQEMAEFATGAECPSTTSTLDQILSATKVIGDAPNSVQPFLTFEELKDKLAQGEPAMAHVENSRLGKYRCSDWDEGHAVTVVGFSEAEGFWRVHDPLCADEATGAFREIPSKVFREAATIVPGKVATILARK